jgi:hypothetical protein
LDQHEGSFIVGTILKELYIDSALKRGDKLDNEYADSKPKQVEPKKYFVEIMEATTTLTK